MSIPGNTARKRRLYYTPDRAQNRNRGAPHPERPDTTYFCYLA